MALYKGTTCDALVTWQISASAQCNSDTSGHVLNA